jgi:hypothetical protein
MCQSLKILVNTETCASVVMNSLLEVWIWRILSSFNDELICHLKGGNVEMTITFHDRPCFMELMKMLVS